MAVNKELLLFVMIYFGCSSAFLFKRGKKPLPIDGGWSAWGSWSTCFMNSANDTNNFDIFRGFSVSSRPRECDSPRPLLGGKPCQGNRLRYRQCECSNALGMESGRIKDSQLSASVGTYKNYNATFGRLGHPPAWCSDEKLSPFASVYYEIDFVNFTKVTGLTTEGIVEGRVGRFNVRHSLDRKQWTLYRARRTSEFVGNILVNQRKFNRFQEPFVTRYLRIYPTRSYNRPCLKTEVYGCVFTCGRHHSSSAGEIIARSQEQFDQNCLWKIDVKSTTSITLDFVTFDLPCKFGYLELKDGSKSYLKSQLLRKLCGSSLQTELLKLPVRNLWLRFYSNSSSDEVGFRARYIAACNTSLQLTGTKVLSVKSQNYPEDYFDNSHCFWTVTSDSHEIYLVFKDFDIEASSSSNTDQCKNDFLLIETSTDGNSFVKLIKYCNSNKPDLTVPLLIRSKTIRIQFKSDDAIVGKGFFLQVTKFDPRKGKPTEKTQTTTSAKSTVPEKPKEVLSNLTPETEKSGSVPVTPYLLTRRADLSTNSRIKPTNGTLSTRNDTELGRRKFQKKKKEADWTVFTIAAFSCFVFILIVFVSVLSVRKCMTGHSHTDNKFLTAAVGKQMKSQSPKSADGKQEAKTSRGIDSRADEQFCQIASPAGSIAHVTDGEDKENTDSETLTRAVVNHEPKIKREPRKCFIDMYSDGDDLDVDENTSCLASERTEKGLTFQAETVL